MQISNWLKLNLKPDFVIGANSANGAYMRRWWILPRNSIFNIYLHNIKRSDDDRALHDHPWWNATIVIRGFYDEALPDGTVKRRKAWGRGFFTIRQPEALHRLILDDGSNTWSLFITGPKVREWGFLCPNGWRHWQEFTSGPNGEEIGIGCD